MDTSLKWFSIQVLLDFFKVKLGRGLAHYYFVDLLGDVLTIYPWVRTASPRHAVHPYDCPKHLSRQLASPIPVTCWMVLPNYYRVHRSVELLVFAPRIKPCTPVTRHQTLPSIATLQWCSVSKSTPTHDYQLPRFHMPRAPAATLPTACFSDSRAEEKCRRLPL